MHLLYQLKLQMLTKRRSHRYFNCVGHSVAPFISHSCDLTVERGSRSLEHQSAQRMFSKYQKLPVHIVGAHNDLSKRWAVE